MGKQKQQGERIYPQSWVACVVVWLLDRLPQHLRKQVLDSYWTEADVELAEIQADEWMDLFGDGTEPPK